jgi:hypothetical protein
VPGTGFVGPARLPFGSQSLSINIAIRGSCFKPVSGGWSFSGEANTCEIASITLGRKTYNAHTLLLSVTGSILRNPTGANSYEGTFSASFKNPGYAFPVAVLGGGGGTTLQIGANGGLAGTSQVTFSG